MGGHGNAVPIRSGRRWHKVGLPLAKVDRGRRVA